MGRARRSPSPPSRRRHRARPRRRGATGLDVPVVLLAVPTPRSPLRRRALAPARTVGHLSGALDPFGAVHPTSAFRPASPHDGSRAPARRFAGVTAAVAATTPPPPGDASHLAGALGGTDGARERRGPARVSRRRLGRGELPGDARGHRRAAGGDRGGASVPARCPSFGPPSTTWARMAPPRRGSDRFRSRAGDDETPSPVSAGPSRSACPSGCRSSTPRRRDPDLGPPATPGARDGGDPAGLPGTSCSRPAPGGAS